MNKQSCPLRHERAEDEVGLYIYFNRDNDKHRKDCNKIMKLLVEKKIKYNVFDFEMESG